MSLAVANYHDVYECFPPAYVADENGQPMHSWRVLVLPFLSDHYASQTYDAYDFSEPWNGPNNSLLIGKRPPVFGLYGGDNEGSHTNYLAVVGKDTVWPFAESASYKDVRDGTSNTIMFVENVGSGIAWTEPRDLNIDTMSMTIDDDPADGISSWLQPPGVAMADGSMRALDLAMTASELRSMLVKNDGQGVGGKATEMQDGRNRPMRGIQKVGPDPSGSDGGVGELDR